MKVFMTLFLLLLAIAAALAVEGTPTNDIESFSPKINGEESLEEEEEEEEEDDTDYPEVEIAEIDFDDRTVHGVSLTPDNWEEETAGKMVFVRFHAYVTSDARLKVNWDPLADLFKDHPAIVVGEVDCSDGAPGEKLCDMLGLEYFPAIGYGDPSVISDLENYDGYGEFKPMYKFIVKELLPKICLPNHTEGCSPEELEQLERFQKMSPSELDAAIAELEAKAKEVDDKMSDYIDDLKATMAKRKEEDEEKINESTDFEEIKFLKRVFRHYHWLETDTFMYSVKRHMGEGDTGMRQGLQFKRMPDGSVEPVEIEATAEEAERIMAENAARMASRS